MEKKVTQGKFLPGENAGNVKSKKILMGIISEQLTEFWTKVLDFSDIAIGDRVRQKYFRSKVLGAGNDVRRFLEGELSKKFIIDYVALSEDIVEIDSPKKRIITTNSGNKVEVEIK